MDATAELICSAPASLPTEPPQRMVMQVPRKMAGMSVTGSSSGTAVSLNLRIPPKNPRSTSDASDRFPDAA